MLDLVEAVQHGHANDPMVDLRQVVVWQMPHVHQPIPTHGKLANLDHVVPLVDQAAKAELSTVKEVMVYKWVMLIVQVRNQLRVNLVIMALVIPTLGMLVDLDHVVPLVEDEVKVVRSTVKEVMVHK